MGAMPLWNFIHGVQCTDGPQAFYTTAIDYYYYYSESHIIYILLYINTY